VKLFKYSGNKERLTKLYRLPDRNYSVKRVVEPYLGSGAFTLNCGLGAPSLGYEVNEDLYLMWQWLKGTTEAELIDLNNYLQELKSKEEKPDLKGRGLEPGPLTYLRVNVCSVVVGQLSSWKVYPQHKLPIDKTIKCLPLLKEFDVVYGSGESFTDSPGDLVFIDPPYVNTSANYKSVKNKKIEAEYQPDNTKELISRLSSPIIFTYGTNAKEVFPEYDWQLIKTIKVPNLRKGGTVDRYEYVSYVNFS